MPYEQKWKPKTIFPTFKTITEATTAEDLKKRCFKLTYCKASYGDFVNQITQKLKQKYKDYFIHLEEYTDLRKILQIKIFKNAEGAKTNKDGTELWFYHNKYILKKNMPEATKDTYVPEGWYLPESTQLHNVISTIGDWLEHRGKTFF